MNRPLLLFLIILLTGSMPLLGQGGLKDYSSHVQTLDKTLETLYAVISGPRGEKRDWDLFRHLFREDARLIPVRKDQEGFLSPTFLTPEDFILQAGPFFEESGFFEKEIHRVTEAFGPITHVFSTYESYRKASDETPFARGINSIQLMHDGDRWWVVNIYWFAESADSPIPDRYLPED